MAMNANEALSLLQSMFETWDRDSLITILQMNHGHVERTIEMILKMNSDAAEAETSSSTSHQTSHSSDPPRPTQSSQYKNRQSNPSSTSNRQPINQSNDKKRLDMDQMLAKQLNMEDDNPRFHGSSAIKNAIAEANAELNSTNKSSNNSHQNIRRRRKGRGVFIDLPADYLQIPYHMYEALCLKRGTRMMNKEEYYRYGQFNKNTTSSSSSSSGLNNRNSNNSTGRQSGRENHDLELAMAMQQELLIQQVAEEEERKSSLGGMLGGLVTDAMDGLDSRWTQQNTPIRSSSSTSQNHARSQARNNHVNNNAAATSSQPRQPRQPMSSNVDDLDDSDSGFSLAKASSFFSTIGEDVKRKVNEVTVKFQTATGSGGYAMNDGTSCGIEGDDDDDDEPLMRRNDPRLTHRAGQMPSSLPPSQTRGVGGSNMKQGPASSDSNGRRRKGD